MTALLHTQILTLRKYQAWRTGKDERTMDEAGIVPAAITSALDAVIAIAENHLRDERHKLATQVCNMQPSEPVKVPSVREFEEWLNEHRRQDVSSVFHEIVAWYTRAVQAHPTADPSTPLGVIQSALDKVQDAMQDAYSNGYQECCGHGVGGECCGNPDATWDAADQRIMDVLNPVQRELSAMLAAASKGAN